MMAAVAFHIVVVAVFVVDDDSLLALSGRSMSWRSRSTSYSSSVSGGCKCQNLYYR